MLNNQSVPEVEEGEEKNDNQEAATAEQNYNLGELLQRTKTT